LRFERHFIQLKSECQDTISYEKFEDAELKIAELETAMTVFEDAGLNTEQGPVVNVKALREQLAHRKQMVKVRKEKELQRAKELQEARDNSKKMTQLYQAEVKQRKIDIQEAAERFKREQKERSTEAAQYKKQMEEMQAQMLVDIDQRLQQHTEARAREAVDELVLERQEDQGDGSGPGEAKGGAHGAGEAGGGRENTARG
jgi:Skp family chaperone for outer membrane proteins